MTDEKKTIVCVEREHGTYKTLSRELISKFSDKISLVHFGTAKDALAYLSSGSADLVISSLLQAQIDGIDLLNDIKELHPNLPVIIYTNLEYKDEFFAWGHKPDAYVVRGKDGSDLPATVERLLESAR
ncbi:MAG TPA: response regulator [Dissulfurispiraceae bacterium]|nr:response regulator [Dissulfurispiraceae bacterium]